MKSLIIGITAAAALSACGQSDATDAEVAPVSSSSCVDVLTVGDQDYLAWTMSNELERDLVGKSIEGASSDCSEGDSGTAATVTLRRIEGIPGKQALVDPDHPDKTIIYVRGDAETTFDDLSKKVQQLVTEG